MVAGNRPFLNTIGLRANKTCISGEKMISQIWGVQITFYLQFIWMDVTISRSALHTNNWELLAAVWEPVLIVAKMHCIYFVVVYFAI